MYQVGHNRSSSMTELTCSWSQLAMDGPAPEPSPPWFLLRMPMSTSSRSKSSVGLEASSLTMWTPHQAIRWGTSDPAKTPAEGHQLRRRLVSSGGQNRRAEDHQTWFFAFIGTSWLRPMMYYEFKIELTTIQAVIKLLNSPKRSWEIHIQTVRSIHIKVHSPTG